MEAALPGCSLLVLLLSGSGGNCEGWVELTRVLGLSVPRLQVLEWVRWRPALQRVWELGSSVLPRVCFVPPVQQT